MGVAGLDSFREKFRDYPDCYTIIGGTACDILMSKADMVFRATKDIDMIILLEDRYQDFAKLFWEYIKEGHYRCGWKTSEDVHFYRFTDPVPGYPRQIELFSRRPDYHLNMSNEVIPIHIDEDVSSLSAIVLNDDFYEFMMAGRKTIDGLSILSAESIIPFKMYAWLNLMQQKEQGKHVNSRDLRKHKYDVFRLLQIIPAGTKVVSQGLVKETINEFLEKIETEELALRSVGIVLEKEQAISLLTQIYIT